MGAIVSGVLLAVLMATGEYSAAQYIQRVLAISLGVGLAFLLFFP